VKRPLRLIVIASALALASFSVSAQPQQKVPRIAVVFAAAGTVVQGRFEAFRQGMRELGYVEGKNIVIEGRYADNQADRLPALIAEFARLKVDVIVTGGSASTRAAKEATSTIPIVMGRDADPVGTGIVASLARPGGNITGLSTIAPQIAGKQLALLKEIAPGLSRVAVIANSTQSATAQSLKEAERAAAKLRVRLQPLDLRNPQDVETVLEAAREGRAQGLLVVTSFGFLSQRTRIAEFSMKNRLPSMYPTVEYVEAGGLMAYGASTADGFRRAAIYVDKILKGARPADLPVEQPTKFELVINMKTAKALGLTIPPSVMLQADRVIE